MVGLVCLVLIVCTADSKHGCAVLMESLLNIWQIIWFGSSGWKVVKGSQETAKPNMMWKDSMAKPVDVRIGVIRHREPDWV